MIFTALLVVFQSLWVSVTRGEQVNGEEDEKTQRLEKTCDFGPL